MLQLKLIDHLSKEQIKKRLEDQQTIRGYKQWQIIYSVANNPGRKSEDMAQVLGISKEIFQRVVRRYNKNGENFQDKIKWGGRRNETSYLSADEERQMMIEFSKKASAGKILTAKDIKKEVEKKLNKAVSDDYIWDLFNRCGWSKKAPRPRHPKQDISAQEEFKKNSPKSWQPAT